MTLRRSTLGRVAAAALVFIVAAAFVAYRFLPAPLGHNAPEQLFGAHNLDIGELAYFGLWPLGLRGDREVRVTSARVTGVPEGMEVVAYHAVWLGDSSRIGAGPGDPALDDDLRLHPLSDLRLKGPREHWYVLVTLRITKPGTWVSKGVDVSWRSGLRRGTVHLPYELEVSTSKTNPDGV